MKTCTNCNTQKNEAEFGKRAASPDGLTSACKQCLRDRDASRYPKERAKRLARMREYAAGAGREKCNAAKRTWATRNQDKRAAHVILGNAVRDGRVEKKPCEKCGAKAEAHHDDYSKPLDVRWLCDKHHKEHHSNNDRNPV